MPGKLTVITAPASTALITLADLKADLGITISDDDAVLTRMIAQASGLIAGYCGRALGAQTVAETFRTAGFWCAPVNDGQPLVLSLPYVSSITSIVEDGGDPLTEDVDFEVDYRAGLLWRLSSGCRCLWSASTIVVTYASGWQLPDGTPTAGVPALPAEVEAACSAMIRSAYGDRARGDLTVTSDQQEGVGRTQYAVNMNRSAASMVVDDGVAAILWPYVVRAI